MAQIQKIVERSTVSLETLNASITIEQAAKRSGYKSITNSVTAGGSGGGSESLIAQTARERDGGNAPGSTQFVSTAAASVGALAGQSTSTIINTVEQNYLQSLSRYLPE